MAEKMMLNFVNRWRKISQLCFNFLQFFYNAKINKNFIWVRKSRVLHYIKLERHVWDRHSSLLGSLIYYEENKCCEYGTRSLTEF
jgi:hypothetical protein